MNREIKFRVWLPEDEIMLYSENDINGDFMEIWSFEGVEIQETRFREMGGEIHEVSDYVKPENQSLMQFTGLKDKNAKDIYESDILKCDFSKDGSHDSIQVVEFYEGSFGSRNKNDHFRIPALFSGRATEGMNLNYYEVIGNIHENKDLLS